jgi:hypothetical protein
MTMKKKTGEYQPIKKFMQWLKNPTITETIKLNRLRWFGHVQWMEKNRIPKKIYYIWIWKQRGWEVDQEIDGKMKWGRTED